VYAHALVRPPAGNCGDGLTTAGLGPPDPGLFLAQHEAYVAALAALGLGIVALPPAPGFPDAHFVEDTAVVLPEVAVIARPGAAARRGEERSVADVLARHRPTVRIEAPGTLEGGDVLTIGRRVLIGLSARTNEDGAAQLARQLSAHGYAVTAIPVGDGLHLKSGINWLGGDDLLVTAAFADRSELRDYRRWVVPEAEAYAANTLWINDSLLVPSGFPRTRRILEALGLRILELDVGEVRKMDGGLTCLSLRF
jgi:dimethylargininase